MVNEGVHAILMQRPTLQSGQSTHENKLRECLLAKLGAGRLAEWEPLLVRMREARRFRNSPSTMPRMTPQRQPSDDARCEPALGCKRILRHSDPRTTASTYLHLEPGYLRREIDLLSFAPAAATSVASPPNTRAGSPEPLRLLLFCCWVQGRGGRRLGPRSTFG